MRAQAPSTGNEPAAALRRVTIAIAKTVTAAPPQA